MANEITYEQRVHVYDKLLARNGMLLQSVVALEELSEAQKEICKMLREKGDIDHLAEEIADATIMLEQMRHYFGINQQVCDHMDMKIRKMVARLMLEEN